MTGDAHFRQCTVCVLDTRDDPHMKFDSLGRCHYFHEYNAAAAKQIVRGEEGHRLLADLTARIKADGRGKRYDSIMGLSGGADSSYVAYLAAKLGLRPLAVHLDNGWNSELAVENIRNIVQRLEIDLHTHVIDWNEFRDLQIAYLRASVVDIEVVTDHAIFATLYKLAARHGIRHILSGTNIVTEQVLPPHWIYAKTDHVNIRAIHREFGTVALKTYPFMDLKVKKIYQLLRGIRSHSILNYVDYNNVAVRQAISRELGWRDYGGKHHESIFTRFYQGYILPEKFGIDKRKAHFSNLIFAGQMTKAEALEELRRPPYDPAVLAADKEFVTKKLQLSVEQFDALMALPARPHTDFETERPVYDRYPVLGAFRRPMQFITSRLN